MIVDDLVDTGKTARLVRDMLPDAHFATVYAKPMGRPLVDTFITEVSQDTWIFFPLGYRAVVPAADPRRRGVMLAPVIASEAKQSMARRNGLLRR